MNLGLGVGVGFTNPRTPPTPLDSVVVAYEAAVQGQSGTVSTASKNALNDFVTTIRGLGLWGNVVHCYAPASDAFAGARVPLVSGSGSTLLTFNGFSSLDYGLTTGLAGNGSSKYADTGVNASGILAASRTIVVYESAKSGGTNDVTIGVDVATNVDSAWGGIHTPTTRWRYKYVGNEIAYDSYSQAGGCFICSGEKTLYFNGTSVGTPTGDPTGTTIANLSYYALALNRSGTAFDHSAARLGMTMILNVATNSSQSSSVDAACHTLMTALGRGVAR